MIRKIALACVVLSLTTSCVSKKIYQDLENKYADLKKEHNALSDENTTLKTDKNQLEADKNKLQSELDKTKAERDKLAADYAATKKNLDNLNLLFIFGAAWSSYSQLIVPIVTNIFWLIG